jgi:hypothetical protein
MTTFNWTNFLLLCVLAAALFVFGFYPVPAENEKYVYTLLGALIGAFTSTSGSKEVTTKEAQVEKKEAL